MQKKLIMNVNYGGEYLSGFWTETLILSITFQNQELGIVG